jgi:hypothetical protein
MKTVLGFFIFMSFALSVRAEELDKASKEALQQTQQLLKNPEQRRQAVKGDAKAQKADQYVNSLTGGNEAVSDEMYQFAAEIMGTLTKDTGGDPQKMQERLKEFMANPEAFANQLTPEQQKRLKELAQKMPASTGRK